MDALKLLLKSAYGIIAASITPTPGGFSTKAAYRITGMDGMEYFLKTYDNSLPTTRFFVERIDTYMPILDRLSSSPTLCGRVLTPVKTLSGTYKASNDNEVYVLFLFVHGDTPGIQGMTRSQTMELAEILACLHDVVEDVSFEASVLNEDSLNEDISLPFCGHLMRFLNTAMEQGALHDIISPNIYMLHNAINKTTQLHDTVRIGYSPLVLCHGDAHGYNVIQSRVLVLADWENLHLAPVEADLFIQAWHPHGDLLLKTYAATRRGYRINRELLYFYTLRRRIEDVWVDIQRLTEEKPNEAEKTELLNFIETGIEEIKELYSEDISSFAK